MTDSTPALPASSGLGGDLNETETASKRPVLRVLIFILLLIAGVLAWTVASDHHAPGNSRGIVSASVVQIAPRVSGRVISIEAEDNAILGAGDTLYRLDPRPFELVVEQARAGLAQAMQGVDASAAQLQAAQAQVAQARINLETSQRAATRTTIMFGRGIVSSTTRDEANAALDMAVAALDTAEANAESVRRQLGASGQENPQIRAAELALEQAEFDLLSTTVRAPGPGVVTNVHLGIGHFIPAGSPTMTFIDNQALWVTADLRENQLVNVDPGDRVTLAFDALPGEIFEGQVESIGWGINPGRSEVGGLPLNTPATQWFEPARSMPVRIVLGGGSDSWPDRARLGGKVNVLIHPDEESGLTTRTAAFFQKIGSYLSALY